MKRKLTGDAYASASKAEKRAELARRAEARLAMGRGGVRTTARLKAARASASASAVNFGGGKGPVNSEPKTKGVAGNLTSTPSPLQAAYKKRKRQRSGRGRRTRGGIIEG